LRGKRKKKEAIRQQLEQEQEEGDLRENKRNASEQIVRGKAEILGPKTVVK